MSGVIENDVMCFSCGRFVGTLSRCEYCGSEIRNVQLLPLARVSCIVAALASLILLWCAGYQREPPLVAAASIRPSMNYALVRIKGRICSRPYVRSGTAGDYVSFLVNDGSGVVRMCLSGENARGFVNELGHQLLNLNIEAVGVVQIREGEVVKLFLRRWNGDRLWACSQ